MIQVQFLLPLLTPSTANSSHKVQDFTVESLKHETQWNAAPNWAGVEGVILTKVLCHQSGTITSTIHTDSRDIEWVKKNKKGYPELKRKKKKEKYGTQRFR